MKKRLFLSAYVRTNPGDDMMVLTLLRRYPRQRFFLYCHPRHRAPFRQEKNVRFICPLFYYADRLLLRLIKKEPFRLHFRKNATVIQIGGSMYIEPARFDPNAAAFQLNPQFIIGANFGPYKTEAYLNHICQLLGKTRDVCFRDSYSASMFAQLSQVRQAPDVLFGYKELPAPKPGTGIGISIIDPSCRPELKDRAEAYFDTLAALIDLCSVQNIPVTLLSFCVEEGDNHALQQIGRRTKSHDYKTFTYNGDPAALLDTMNGCDCIYATRFHAMILGWLLGKKVLPIIYSGKQKNVLEDLGYTGNIWDMADGQPYCPETLLAHGLNSVPIKNTNLLAQQAGGQFIGLDRFFEAT